MGGNVWCAYVVFMRVMRVDRSVFDVFLNCFSIIVLDTGLHTDPGAHGFDEAAGLGRSRDPIVPVSTELGL